MAVHEFRRRLGTEEGYDTNHDAAYYASREEHAAFLQVLQAIPEGPRWQQEVAWACQAHARTHRKQYKSSHETYRDPVGEPLLVARPSPLCAEG